MILYKKGGKSNIHIKEKNQGKFTEWCHRNGFSGVTSECIAAGKRSKNPDVVKMATFADNASHWDHG